MGVAMNNEYIHMDEQSLQEILSVLKQNLSLLQIQAAKFGSAIPLSILNDIKSHQGRIDGIVNALSLKTTSTVKKSDQIDEKRTILIIDDDSRVVDEISDNLEQEGYTVICALNGLQGLKLASRHIPDMILLDIDMPVMDGHSVLSEIVERKLSTRVIIMSSANASITTTIRMGASDFIQKPFKASDVLPIIESSIEIDD
jgi:CheY-like chemotaxis protein